MAEVDIINEVWKRLTDDADYLTALKLTSGATIEQKNQKVQKEQEPIGLSTTNIPMTCIYPVPGDIDGNNALVYNGMFQLDTYAPSLFMAMSIGKKARALLANQDLPVKDSATFPIQFVSSAAGESRIQGIKKYTMRFEVSEVVN